MLKSFVLIVAVTALSTKAAPSQKIVGGHFAEKNQFPYQIGLFYNEKFRCGGSIIDSQWVLTAAHCVLREYSKIPPHDLLVYAGSILLKEGGHFFGVEETFAHESYEIFENDIALIKLKKPIEFDKTMQKIELNREELPPKTSVVISGYGRSGTELDISPRLKYNTMHVVPDFVCEALVGIGHKGLMCFNADEGNGACSGDSGGPAVFDGKLVGVANFVMESCGTSSPDAYAKVAYFVDWIEETMKGH